MQAFRVIAGFAGNRHSKDLIHDEKRLECRGGMGKVGAMRYRVIVAGKTALAYAKAATGEYLKRLRRYGSYELTVVKDGDRDAVSDRLLEGSSGCFRIALDERGESPGTRQLALKLDELEMQGTVKSIAFLIGASDGHSPRLRKEADMILSLSSLTMQHELALVVLLEQLYRIATIKSGSPYHRD